MHPLEFGKKLRSPGGSFHYTVLGPCCKLYDRDELPWPSCSLTWKGKQPSWNRQGRRFVPDMAASRCPSYAVNGYDQWGGAWTQVLTIYNERLDKQTKAWWYTRYVPNQTYPELP